MSENVARLLVVDDDEMNRDMLSRRLQRRGYQVDTAEDGQQALDMIEAGVYELILLDIMMPGLSGIEVLETLRRTRTVADLPVIMATAKDQSQDIVQALKLGANDYVTKPIDFPVVHARVRTQLELKRAHDEIQNLASQLEVRNRFIRDVFGRYMSTEVVANILDSPEGLELGGERREIAILVSDLRGFTALSERLPPEQILTLINRYLEAMTDVIMGYGGTIQELMGDGILVFFGAPIRGEDDAERAVACAIAMQLAMTTVNARNRDEGLPVLDMGVGIGTGEIVVGNIGSMKRTKYGAVGSLINATFRIESFTVGGQILVSEAVKEKVGARLEIAQRLEVAAKGVAEPMPLHDVRGIGGRHEVRLAETEEELISLVTPIPVQLSRLEGKQVSSDSLAGSLVKLCSAWGELECDEALDPFCNLRLIVQDPAANGTIGELYGKILGRVSNGSNGHRLHFTAMAPEVESFLKELLPTS